MFARKYILLMTSNENIANNEKTSMVVRVKGDGLDGKVVQIVNIK